MIAAMPRHAPRRIASITAAVATQIDGMSGEAVVGKAVEEMHIPVPGSMHHSVFEQKRALDAGPPANVGDNLQFHREADPTTRDASARRWNRPSGCAEWSCDGERAPDEGEAKVFRQLEWPDSAHGPVVRHRRSERDRIADQ